MEIEEAYEILGTNPFEITGEGRVFPGWHQLRACFDIRLKLRVQQFPLLNLIFNTVSRLYTETCKGAILPPEYWNI